MKASAIRHSPVSASAPAAIISPWISFHGRGLRLFPRLQDLPELERNLTCAIVNFFYSSLHRTWLRAPPYFSVAVLALSSASALLHCKSHIQEPCSRL